MSMVVPMHGIRFEHHGAVNGVTGSCHELFVDANHSVLVDCGLFQGAEVSGRGASAEHLAIDFDLRAVQALLVTHCHLDHVGRIPYLLAAGFQGPIYCSEPTAVLLPVMLEDAVRVGVTRDTRLIRRFLSVLRERIVPVPYKTWVEIPLGNTSSQAARLSVRFQRAGHILGSAYIECDVYSGPQRTRVVFSGDLGAPYSPLLYAPRAPYAADVLVLESTYGDQVHDDRRTRRQRLQQLIERCLRDRGVVLIPAFSIGRTQELLYELEAIVHDARNRGPGALAACNMHWQDLDIIVDSPLAQRFTAVYRQLREFWDREARRRLATGRHPLSFEQLTTIGSHRAHLETIAYLRQMRRPAVVLAASGMCAGGRMVNYLKAFIGEPTTDIVFVGYQAVGTPGQLIQRYGPHRGYVELDGERYAIRAGVHTLGGYSAHADQQTLGNFVRRMRRKPRQVRLIHGSHTAKMTLRTLLETVCPQAQIVVP
jgi:metallo-beta-lactamase family protein